MKELLVPAGNMECLTVAIHSGADAIYVGGKKFGARAFANNFSDEEMVEAIKLCHLYGVKLYVTVNTLIHESEFDESVEYVKFLYENGVDAVIMQDIGLISYVRKIIPGLEIHASTQVHNTNQDTFEFFKDLGVKRVVLARELSVDEIDNIDTPLEKEAFIHGAICVAYSGQCLFSSCILNRSGNRGECAQMCRLPYKLICGDTEIKTDGEYLLSPKELNSSEDFERILKSSIYSLKIEGRMKSPEYVGCVTRLYRDLLNKYYRGEKLEVNQDILNDLMVIFNRKYTKGFINNVETSELMNIKTSNHLGVHLGKVIDVNSKYVWVKLDNDINQGDGVRFNTSNEGMIANFIYDKKERLINEAVSGDIILLDNRFNIKRDEEVSKTLDVKVRDKYLSIEQKRIPININLIAHKNEEMILTIDDGKNYVTVSFGKVESALSSPISEEKIVAQLSKLGGTPYKVGNITIDMDDDIFINIKDINEIRRLAVEELNYERCKINVEKYRDINIETEDNDYDEKVRINVLVRNEEQLKWSLANNIDIIYVPDIKLYEKYKDNENVLYRTNRVKDTNTFKSLVTELGSLNRIRSGVGDYFLNVTNHHTIDEMSKYLDRLTLSIELDDLEIANIMNHYNNKKNMEIIIYGTYELMITKYCMLNLLVNKDKICHVCSNDKAYYLVDRNNARYRIINEPVNHLTHIMNATKCDKIEKASMYKDLGINNFRLELLDETTEELNSLLDRIREVI